MSRDIYSSAAHRDVRRALDYYKREAGVEVANDFIDQLESKVAKILQSPESFHVVTKDLRCANLNRFPYQIVYRVVKSTIRVVSIRHHKRHPDFGLDRLNLT